MENEKDRIDQTGEADSRKEEEKASKNGEINSALKKNDEYPIYAVIICAGAALGHTLGKYVFTDLMTWTSIGMFVGIVAAILYGKIAKKKA